MTFCEIHYSIHSVLAALAKCGLDRDIIKCMIYLCYNQLY